MRTRHKPAIALSFVLGLISIAGCTSTSAHDTSFTPQAASAKLHIDSDSFSFGNFGTANTLENFGASDLVDMFGSSVCTSSNASPCALKAEVAAWAQMVNQSREQGHCEGMVVEAQSRFNLAASPATATLTNAGDTTHAIFRAFATQFLPQVQSQTNEWAKKSVKEKLTALSRSLATGKLEYTMGLYSTHGGHAILPYSIDYPDSTRAVIHYYDSNWPLSDRYLTVDLKSGEWSFPFGGADPSHSADIWTGEWGDMDLSPLSARVGRSTPFSTIHHADGNFLVIKSSLPTWTVKTQSGELSVAHPTSADGWVRPLRTSIVTSGSVYLVNTSSSNVFLTTPDKSSVFAVTSRAIAHVSSPGSSKPIEINPESVQITDPALRTSFASGDLAVTVSGISATISSTGDAVEVTSSALVEPVVANASRTQLSIEKTSGNIVTTTGSDFTVVTAPSIPISTTTTPTATVPTTSPQRTSTTIATSTTTPMATVSSLQIAITPTVRNGQVMGTVPVRLLDNAGNQMTTGSFSVTATLSNGNGTLSGTTTVSSAAGLASFSNLTVSGSTGASYTITFTTGAGASTSFSFVLAP